MNQAQNWPTDQVPTTNLSLRSATVTQGGQRRVSNRDVVFEHTTLTNRGDSISLYIVCDGFGNDHAEFPASQIAVQAIVSELESIFSVMNSQSDPSLTQPSLLTVQAWLQTAVAYANHKVWSYNQSLLSEDEPAIGTTLTLVLVYGDHAFIANIGDSRTYIWRAGQITQITRDHSWVAELVRSGLITEDEAVSHPQKNIICRALGLRDQVEADFFKWQLLPGDKLLLCTDGLWKSFPDATELSDWLSLTSEPEEICDQLVAEASYRDDFDDIGVVHVQVNRPVHLHEKKTANVHSPIFAKSAVPAPIVLMN